VPHGNIDVLTHEVGVMHGDGHPEIKTGVRLGKAVEAMHQPLCRKIWRGADCEDPGTLPLSQPLCPGSDAVKCVPNHREIVATRESNPQTLMLTSEQLDAEFSFERLHLLAHRTRSDAELFRRLRETFAPGSGLKRSERVKRGQSARHER
jgi:hypothetical protein